MTTPTDPQTSEPDKDASADELEADIERTREQLGETVDALSQKFDFKTQAQHKMRDARQRATEQANAARARGGQVAARFKKTATDEQGKVKPVVPAGAALVGAVIVVVLVVWRRQR